MSDSAPSVSKTIAWLLAILLIGVVALYSWHNEKQAQNIADKDAEISKSTQLLSAKDQAIDQTKEAEQGLRAEIGTLSSRYDSEKKALEAELNAAGRAQQALRDDIEALKTQHAQTLVAEQEKAQQAYAVLQSQHDDAKQQIAVLGTDIENLNRSLSDAAAAREAQMAEAKSAHASQLAEAKSAHEAQTLQLEHELNEKVAFYRTALEGSDPERAAQIVSLELQSQTDRQALGESRQAMQAMQEKETNLNQQLAGAKQGIAERDQALADTQQRLEGLHTELTQSQSALSALQQQHDTAMAQAAEKLAATRKQLEAAEAEHAKTKTDAAAAKQEAERRISDLSAKLQAETAALLDLRQKHESRVAELQGSLDSTKQTLAEVEADLTSAKDAAVLAQQTHDQQIGEAQTRIDGLEENLDRTKRKAEQDLEASKREGEEAVAYVREVYTEFSKLGGRHTDRGMLLSLAEEELRFRISKADLPEGELPSLDWIAELLVTHPKLTARIEGHTDGKGREETNLELSQQRADAVKQALTDRGVPAERMASAGIGAARPIADNGTSWGRRLNRRVEVYVSEE
jgi:outer membrane protein OmpA-like peptidoglycan-associated protein